MESEPLALWEIELLSGHAEVLNGTVTIGDRVAYPTRSGSDMHTVIGTVVEVAQGFRRARLKVHAGGNYRRDVWLTELYRVVKI